MKNIAQIALTSALILVGFSFELESGPSPSIILSANHWTPIGPAPGGGFFSGRIDVAAPHPSDPNVMYVGATCGGIWKTANFLDSSPDWTPLTDKPQILSLATREHSLVVFPGNPNIVLAAASGPGGGIMRSDDGGNTWSYFANSKFDLAEFGALVADPNVPNAQTLYVAISAGTANFVFGSGLYKSTDGGATWTDTGSGTFSGLVSDLLQIQENGQTVLYAADTDNGQASGGAIYRSDDGGMTWSATGFPTNGSGYNSIRLAGSTQPVERIYASAIDNTGLDTRYSTQDMGGSWSALTWPDAPGGAGAPTHRFRHNLLAVDPSNSNIVFVNTDLESNLIHDIELVYKSTDGGQSWTLAGGAGDPVSATFDSQDKILACGDNGVYSGASLSYKGGNLNTVPFYSFSLDPTTPRSAYGLMQDAPGSLKYSDSLVWGYAQPANGQGESGKIRVDPGNASRLYYFDPNTQDPVNAPTAAARFVHSDEGGTTSWSPNWVPAITGLPTVMANGVTITDYGSFPGKGSIVIDPNNPKRLLVGIHNSVYETTTGGDPNNSDPNFAGNGWRDLKANTVIANSTWVSAIAMAPSDANTVYVGTEDGRVFKTTNAGAADPSWTEVDSGLPQQNQRIMDIEVSPTDPDFNFAVTSPFVGRDDNAPDLTAFDHVWMRNGGGWSPISGNLPTKLGGETLAVDWQPATPVLYIGTLRGAFQSTDLGANWTRFGSLPRTRVTDLDFMPGIHLLGAGTMGWGGWLILTQSTPPTVTPPGNQTAVEGNAHSFNLGSFSDPDGGPWKVYVDWDGTSYAYFGTDSPGAIASLGHIYYEEGQYTVKITVTDLLTDQSDTATFTVDVSDPPVDATGGSIIEINAGTDTGPQNVATFTDPGGAEPNEHDSTPPTSAGHYSASINWGDVTTSPGSITPLVPTDPTQVFTITGNHTYSMLSPATGFNVITTINHEGVISMANTTAFVGRAGHVNGGGKIGDKREFNFDVHPKDHTTVLEGDVRYKDKANNIDLKRTSITFINILSDDVHATVKGTATVNGVSGYTFRIDAEDNGKKGKDTDRFRIQISGPTNYDSNNFAPNAGLLTDGNIDVHEEKH